MVILSRFESSLLTIARSLVGLIELDEALHLMRREHPRPGCLSRGCVELLQDTLAKGLVQRCAKWGWRETRHLTVAGGSAAIGAGRLWNRVSLEGRELHFSRASLEFLLWITEHNAGQPARPLPALRDNATLADRLLLIASLIAVHDTQIGSSLAAQPAYGNEPLAQLLFPEHFPARPKEIAADFTYWFASEHAWFLETLLPLLAARWRQLETAKRATTDRRWLMQLSARQAEVLRSFLDTAQAAGRRDLARFLLAGPGRLLLGRAEGNWFANLDLSELRLSEREETYRAGLAVFTMFDRLRAWQHEAAMVGYYDEGYAASQLYKSDWESLRGAEICDAAAALVRSYTSLKQWEHT